MPDSGRQAEIAPATSPSEISRIRAPAARTSSISLACRGRSRMQTVTSETDALRTLAIRWMLAAMGEVMSMKSATSGPPAILFM